MMNSALDLRVAGKVEAILSSRRDNARREAEDRRAYAYSICPMLEDLEYELSSVSADLNKKLLDGELTVSDTIKNIEEKSASIRAKQLELLTYHGLPSDRFRNMPACAICGDSGRVNVSDSQTVFCECYEDIKQKELLSVSNIRETWHAGFELFDETLIPEIYRDKDGRIIGRPREKILSHRDKLKDYVNTFRSRSPSARRDNLYFFGQAGTGKTYFALSVALELIKLGVSVIYHTAPNLFNIITAHRMKAFSDDKYDPTPYNDLFEANVLMIDDWGTESMTTSRYSEYLTLLNERSIDGRKSTVITSNLNMQEVRKDFDERVYSRIMGSYRFFEFIGPDIRAIIRINNLGDGTT